MQDDPNQCTSTHLVLVGEKTGEDQRLLPSGPLICTHKIGEGKDGVEQSHQMANSTCARDLTIQLLTAHTDMYTHTHTHSHIHTHTHPTVESPGYSSNVDCDKPPGL